jgi:hypothetical protein
MCCDPGLLPAASEILISEGEGSPRPPSETDAAVVRWMRDQGWNVLPARWEQDPETGFHVWQEEEPPIGRSHALWVAESMVTDLPAGRLLDVLNHEGVADEIRISYKVRIQERGDGFRVSVVPRRSGESRRVE